jgi:hypothetical protein
MYAAKPVRNACDSISPVSSEGDAAPALTVASFAGLDSAGRFQIMLPDAEQPAAALSTVALAADDAGAAVVVAFDTRDGSTPIIIGRLEHCGPAAAAAKQPASERLVFKAEREIELRCGDASIVLTRAGKVLIKGNFVLTRSRGANKIKGAYVAIN